ncbi:IclR family transcriptional regulator [Mesorhizobium sp. 1B3]|uniref:IclR family transcriptional regulator n=1 Tax=Mesorhizobium sp. 1B3 TaxID=3243599 RepID=UPI003D960CAA
MRVRQVENVLNLLEIFAREKTPMTLTAVSRALGIPKSSAFNLIDTLLARGLLYETRPRGGFYPTGRLYELARSIKDGDRLVQRIHGELELLAETTGETALLAVREDQDVVYVDVVESSAPIRYFAKVGDRRPIYTTSSGKAILSSYSEPDRARILAGLTYIRHQETTVSGPQELASRLDEGRARGWCEDLAEFTPDVIGFAVPILHGERRFGLAVAGPHYRMQAQRDRLVASLRSAGDRIRRILDAA